MTHRGATVWARQTTESEVFCLKPAEWFKIWFYVVNRANHTDNKLFSRGENLMTYREIEESTNTTRSQVDGFIRWSKKEQMLTTRKTTRGFVVKVLNYAKYQDWDTYKADQETTQKTKQKRHRNDTITKNDIHVNNTSSDFSERTKLIAKTLGVEPTDGLATYADEIYRDYSLKADTLECVEWYTAKGQPVTILKWMRWIRKNVNEGKVKRMGEE